MERTSLRCVDEGHSRIAERTPNLEEREPGRIDGRLGLVEEVGEASRFGEVRGEDEDGEHLESEPISDDDFEEQSQRAVLQSSQLFSLISSQLDELGIPPDDGVEGDVADGSSVSVFVRAQSAEGASAGEGDSSRYRHASFEGVDGSKLADEGDEGVEEVESAVSFVRFAWLRDDGASRALFGAGSPVSQSVIAVGTELDRFRSTELAQRASGRTAAGGVVIGGGGGDAGWS